eukprot:scaffold2156_cov115-Cylindrotheca_fusiformis.AAC.17
MSSGATVEPLDLVPTSAPAEATTHLKTFTSLGYNAGLCAVIGCFALICFSCAVRGGHNGQLAPRTWSRPKEVLTNVLKKPYGLSWIPWTLSLTYHEMLEGIPGTGTRRGGKEGALLKCNLDAIVVMKFHALLMKVAIFATIVCCIIILPINMSAPCSDAKSGIETCRNITKLGPYAKTTLANIPPMTFVEENYTDVVINSTDGGFHLEPLFKNIDLYFTNDSGITWRLLAIVIVAWSIYIYACCESSRCYLIWNEWIENAALRRVYFLEAEHFDSRRQEQLYLANLKHEYVKPDEELRQFLPHPELRETVPPVSLYSALYKLPKCDVISVDEQLQATIEFFDKCVPNQPGFSSSVAAATILPDPGHLAQIWKKFYACSTQVRRLRFIRHQLKLKVEEQGANDQNNAKVVDDDIIMIGRVKSDGDVEAGYLQSGRLDKVKLSGRSSSKRLNVETSFVDPTDPYDTFGYDDFDLEDLHMQENLETLAVFEREFAQSAACCPNGMCNDSKIRYADTETLLEMLEETQDQLELAKKELFEARANHKLSSVAKQGAGSKEHDEVVANLSGSTRSPRLQRFSQHRELVSLTQELETSTRRRRMNTDVSNQADSGVDDFDSLEAPKSIPQSSSGTSPASTTTQSPSPPRLWELANRVVLNNERPWAMGRLRYRQLADGQWSWNRFTSIVKDILPTPSLNFSSEAVKKKPKKYLDALIEEQKYAVVTFTSRQAAVSARQCVADASGVDRWVEVDSIPVPPLADSPPYNILFCRGCCKPVTLTLNDAQKNARNNATIAALVLFCLMYTVPLSLTSTYFSDTAQEAWPEFPYHSQVSGFISGGLYTIFFSVCPFIFKLFANYGSNATSIRQAEFKALRYYWFFILVTAFAGQSLVSMVISGYLSTSQLGNQAQVVVMDVAKTIPTNQSVVWINWIIIRVGFTLPVNYLLQFNSFLFKYIPGMRCCSRVVSGGGAGGPLPYRLYVDAGLVFLCIVALAPASPIVAPVGFCYFLVATPILRWLLIFVYRPMYDGGGMRWPLLHQILISALVTSQILLLAMMVLKNAYGPALVAGLAVIPTLLFNKYTCQCFLRPYSDAGLLQTSQLDGWDYVKLSSYESREEFRKWLVDCHKASFIPICLAGKDNFFSYEPAVAIPDEAKSPTVSPSVDSKITSDSEASCYYDSEQKGAMFRRMTLSGAVAPGMVHPDTLFDGDLYLSAGESEMEDEEAPLKS